MKLIETKNAVGHVLCHDLTRIVPGEFKGAQFRKGHVVTEEDIPMLLSMGKEHLYVWEMEPGMLHENDAAERLCRICKNEHMTRGEVKEGKIEIGNKFMEQNPNVTIQFNFDSSGTLKTQIQEGADCDVFISAGQKQMNQIDKDASTDVNTEGLDFVLEGTRFDILENKVTLVVPEGNPKNITSFDDLANGLKDGTVLLAMGNSDVPVGQYTQKILKYYELDEEALAASGSITYGSNVKEVTTQVSEATVDCGIIYCTDAFSAGLTIADYATAEMCGQVIYPAAVLNVSKNVDTAKAFLDFCCNEESRATFEAVGFTALNK